MNVFWSEVVQSASLEILQSYYVTICGAAGEIALADGDAGCATQVGIKLLVPVWHVGNWFLFARDGEEYTSVPSCHIFLVH